MPRLILTLVVLAVFTAGCPKGAGIHNPAADFHGIWIRKDDPPGRQPADTLFFSSKNGKDFLSFYSAGSPGPNWPSQAETEYKFENGKLTFRDYTGNTSDYRTMESFQYTHLNKEFTVRLHEILLYMSADYFVTYRKVE